MSRRVGDGSYVQAIEQMMKLEGPFTATELGNRLGIPRHSISSIVSRMHQGIPKRLMITGYCYEDDDALSHNYPRAIYDWGDGPDIDKPMAKTSIQRTAKWRGITKLKVASVFDLAAAMQKARGNKRK